MLLTLQVNFKDDLIYTFQSKLLFFVAKLLYQIQRMLFLLLVSSQTLSTLMFLFLCFIDCYNQQLRFNLKLFLFQNLLLGGSTKKPCVGQGIGSIFFLCHKKITNEDKWGCFCVLLADRERSLFFRGAIQYLALGAQILSHPSYF